MKKSKLTKVERRILKAWKAAGLAVKANTSTIRGMSRRTAYHEAGHVAARMFTGLDSGHIIHVSIIPEGEMDGHERSERNTAEFALDAYPPPLMRTVGRCLLLGMLAGRGAEARVAVPEDREDILDEGALFEQGEEEGTDLFRALRIADIMAGPRMPARRILEQAAKWTDEMLALPDVWRCVETLAGMLLERGTIEDADEIMAVCDGILYASLKLPKWKRRLSVTKAEVEAMKRTRKRS
jgi:hypothetical protein